MLWLGVSTMIVWMVFYVNILTLYNGDSWVSNQYTWLVHVSWDQRVSRYADPILLNAKEEKPLLPFFLNNLGTRPGIEPTIEVNSGGVDEWLWLLA